MGHDVVITAAPSGALGTCDLLYLAAILNKLTWQRETRPSLKINARTPEPWRDAGHSADGNTLGKKNWRVRKASRRIFTHIFPRSSVSLRERVCGISTCQAAFSELGLQRSRPQPRWTALAQDRAQQLSRWQRITPRGALHTK